MQPPAIPLAEVLPRVCRYYGMRPCGLQILTVRFRLSQSLVAVGECLNQSLQGVELLRSLQPLAFGECFDQSFHAPSRGDTESLFANMRMDADACLQSLTLGEPFSQGLQVLRGRGQPAAIDLGNRLLLVRLASH